LTPRAWAKTPSRLDVVRAPGERQIVHVVVGGLSATLPGFARPSRRHQRARASIAGTPA